MEKPTETASIPDASRDTHPPLPPLPPLPSIGSRGPGGSGGLWNRNFRYFFVARTVALFG
ncbi:MFS transporter, partial [Streptomyces sp. SID2119]|nr:MFS transporter [Streptomyces sp. SID2119]